MRAFVHVLALLCGNYRSAVLARESTTIWISLSVLASFTTPMDRRQEQHRLDVRPERGRTRAPAVAKPSALARTQQPAHAAAALALDALGDDDARERAREQRRCVGLVLAKGWAMTQSLCDELANIEAAMLAKKTISLDTAAAGVYAAHRLGLAALAGASDTVFSHGDSPVVARHSTGLDPGLRVAAALYTTFWPAGLHIGNQLATRLQPWWTALRRAQSAHDTDNSPATERALVRARQRYEGQKRAWRRHVVYIIGLIVGMEGQLGLPRLSGAGLRHTSKALSRQADAVGWGTLEKAILSMAARRCIRVVLVDEYGERRGMHWGHWR